MELFGSTSRGGFSVRGIFTFVMVVVVTALLWVIVGSQPAHAADANWSGDTLIFDNHSYNKTTDFKDMSNTIPSGATVYQSPPQTGTTANSQKVFIIYFTSGVDPPTATKASYAEFTYSNNQLSNPTNKKTITLTPQGEESEYTSCSVQGIGWIICPVSVFLAEAMDNIFGILAGMIAVQPSVVGDPNNSMYIAWNVMRNIANVAFVIVFLIIIYSQLTNIGVTNYGIKKLIPRLIVAAVLVNLSFIVSAAAIDLSNILGYSIQNVFNVIRENTFNITNDNFAGINENPWSIITTVILAGGGAYGAYFAAGSVGGALYLLIPLLIGLILTLIFVVVILAARQAIIIILVIIAPIAFVANLLPNTEKWFDKWKDLFFTMLIFFPAFSLVFGGSQLAGQLIIQNANGNIVTVLFGMAVQIAPLVITPLILKFSGGLLGKIAQITNNPRKGIMDRSNNWANSRAEKLRQKSMSTPTKNPFRRSLQFFDDNAKKTKDRTELYKLRADNRYHGSKAYQKIHSEMDDAETDKKIVSAKNELHSIKQVRSDGKRLEKEMTARVRADQVVDLKGRLDNTYEDLKSGQGKYAERSDSFGKLETEAVYTTRAVALNAMRQQSAKRAQSDELYKQLKLNELTMVDDNNNVQVLRDYAGGVQGHVGAQRALAQAISEQQRAHNEIIGNANAILDDYNLDAASNLKIAQNQSVPGIDISITPDIQEAAIKRVAANGVIPHINQLLTSVDFSASGNEDYRTALVEALRGNSNRPKYIGQSTMDKLTQGGFGTIDDTVINGWIEAMLVDGKLSAKELATQDNDTLVRVMQALPDIRRTTANPAAFDSALNNLQKEIVATNKDAELWNVAGERKDTIRTISKNIQNYTGATAIPEKDEPAPSAGTGPTDA